VIVCLFVFYVN